MCNAIEEVFEFGWMPAEWKATYFTLLNLTKLEHYRPISLCCTLYKIVVRVLVERLETEIGDLVSTKKLPLFQKELSLTIF